MSFFDFFSRKKKSSVADRQAILDQVINTGSIPSNPNVGIGEPPKAGLYNFMTGKYDYYPEEEESFSERVQREQREKKAALAEEQAERKRVADGELKALSQRDQSQDTITEKRLNFFERVASEKRKVSQGYEELTDADDTPYWAKEAYKLEEEHGKEGATKILRDKEIGRLQEEEEFTLEEAESFVDNKTPQRGGLVDDASNLAKGFNARRKKNNRLREEFKAEFIEPLRGNTDAITEALVRLEDPTKFVLLEKTGSEIYQNYIDMRKSKFASAVEKDPEKFLERIAEATADDEESKRWLGNLKGYAEKTAVGLTDLAIDATDLTVGTALRVASPEYEQQKFVKTIDAASETTNEVLNDLIETEAKKKAEGEKFLGNTEFASQMTIGVVEFFPLFKAAKTKRLATLNNAGRTEEAAALANRAFKAEIVPSIQASVAQSGLETKRENEDFAYFAEAAITNVAFDVGIEGIANKIGKLFTADGKISEAGLKEFDAELATLSQEQRVAVNDALEQANRMLEDAKFQRAQNSTTLPDEEFSELLEDAKSSIEEGGDIEDFIDTALTRGEINDSQIEEMYELWEAAENGLSFEQVKRAPRETDTARVKEIFKQDAVKYETAEEFIASKASVHRPPDAEGGSSLDDLTEVYGEDIYSPNGLRYYGQVGDVADQKAIKIIQEARNNPEKEISVFRAVDEGESEEIFAGDWVTPTREYAELHSNSVLNGGGKIVERKVKVKDLITDGNSLQEFGYRPDGNKDFSKKELTDLWEEAQSDGRKFQMRDAIRKDGSLVGVENNLNPIEPQKAEAIVRKYFSEDELDVNFVENIKTPEGQDAFAFYKNDAITFAKNPQASTPEHEVVHAYLDMFTKADEKQSILKQVKKVNKINDDLLAEEFLADEFVRYAQTKQIQSKSAAVKSYIRKIWNQFLGVFGADDKVSKLFDDIRAGKRPKDRLRNDLDTKYQRFADPDASLKAVDEKIKQLETKYGNEFEFSDAEISEAQGLINKLKLEAEDIRKVSGAEFISDTGVRIDQNDINQIVDTLEARGTFKNSKELAEIEGQIKFLEESLGGRGKLKGVKRSTASKNKRKIDDLSNGEYTTLQKKAATLRRSQTRKENLLNDKEFRKIKAFDEFFAYFDETKRSVKAFEKEIRGLSEGVSGKTNLDAAKFYARTDKKLQNRILRHEENVKFLDQLETDFDSIIQKSRSKGKSEVPQSQNQPTPRTNDQPNQAQQSGKESLQTGSKQAVESKSSGRSTENIFSSNDIKPPKAGSVKLLTVKDKGFELPKESWWQAVRRSVEDSNIRLKVMGEEIEKLTKADVPEYVDIWAQKDMLPRIQSRALEKLEIRRRNFVKQLATDDVRVDDLDEYLRAKHAPERNAKMRELAIEEGRDVIEAGSGMTDADAAKIIAKFEADGKIELFEKHTKTLRSTTNETLNFQVKEGLIAKKDADVIRNTYENYVPLQRELDDEAYGLGTGKGLDIRGQEVKKATGSEDLRVFSPTAQIFQAAQKAQVRALKNNIGKSLINLTDEFPMTRSLFKVEKQKMIPKFNEKGEITGVDPTMRLADDVVGVKIDGDQYFVTVKDPLLARSLKNNYSIPSANALTKSMRFLVSTWSSMATRWSPEFLITNFQRDLTDAIINAGVKGIDSKGMGRAIVKDIPSSQKQVWKFLRNPDGKGVSKEITEFFDLGGDTGHFWLQDLDGVEKSLQSLEKSVRNEGSAKITNKIEAAGKFIDDVNGVVELGTRYSFYQNAVKRGMSKKKAVQAAADLTVNFARKGEMTRGMQLWYAFVNPAFQGSSRTIRALATSKRARIAAGGLFGLGFASRAIQDQIGEDSMPDWIKNRQLAFEFPDEFPVVGGKQISLWNVSYGYAPLFAFGSNAYDTMAGKKTAEEGLSNILVTTGTAFLPVSGNSVADFAPTMARPFIELELNQNFMGRRIHPEQAYETFAGKKAEQVSRYTSENAKALATFMSDQLGMDVYPDDIDHLWDSYTAGAGKFVANSADFMQKIAQGEELEHGEIPFVRKFVRDVRDSSAFYASLDRVRERAGKETIEPRIKDQFYYQLEQAVKNDVIDDDRKNSYLRDFLKAQYKIPTSTELNTYQGIENLTQAFGAMREDERKMFLESYAKGTRKKYMKALSDNKEKVSEYKAVYDANRPLVEKLKPKATRILQSDRPKRREAFDKFSEAGLTKADFVDAGLEKLYKEFD